MSPGTLFPGITMYMADEGLIYEILSAVSEIPDGKVATYGQVAALAGNPKMCRAVGNALHKNPDPVGTPCFRVVNAKGELSGEFAFGGCFKLSDVRIPDTVTEIGDQAFQDMDGITSLVIPNSVTTIGMQAGLILAF